ncbi:MAG: hypothetical protein V4659_00355 [Pseudomonadota bacterium]
MDERLNGIRADLALRIAALERTERPAALASDLDDVRRIAHAAGMFPAVTVAHALEAALARGERGALIHGWLDILRDAVRSERTDAGACDTYSAACSVRLAH